MEKGKVKLEPIVEKSELILHPTKTTDKALVVEVGEDSELNVGDKVLIKTTSLTRFNNEDGVYLFIFEDEILAKL